MSWESNQFQVNQNVIRQNLFTVMYHGWYIRELNLFFFLVFLMSVAKMRVPTITSTALLLHHMVKTSKTTWKNLKTMMFTSWIRLFLLPTKKLQKKSLLKSFPRNLELKTLKSPLHVKPDGKKWCSAVRTSVKKAKRLLNIWKRPVAKELFLPDDHTTLILKSTTAFLNLLILMVLLFFRKIQFHIWVR